MACNGNQASPFSINLPPGTVDSNGNNTLDCCECPCGSACAPVVLANLWSNPNGGSVNFASTFSASYSNLFANCPNMAWVMNGYNGGGGYGNYVNGTFDANGNMVIGQINDDDTSFDAGTSTLTSTWSYSDALSIVAYDASASPECSPRNPPAPPSICGSYREPGNSYDYPAFLCGTPNPGCADPVGVDQYGTCCACTTTTTTTTTTLPPTNFNLTWSTTVNNPCDGSPWSITNNGRSIRYNITDSANCGGTCDSIQAGSATASIQVGSAYDAIMTLSFDGIGELEEPEFELISFTLDGDLIADGHAAGGDLGCAVGPIIPNFIIPGPYTLPKNTFHTFEINFTTNDELYHVGSYYQINISFTEI